jgi:(S)-3,5-dihydroxyphenylglycine transaminase
LVELAKQALHASVSDPEAGSMNFLNEIAVRFPDAISLAAGRPFDGFYSTDDIVKYLHTYISYLGEERGLTSELVRRALTQYGRTNGQIHELIARMLAVDEQIRVPAEAIAVTVGCQEAMVIALRALCASRDDVLLAASPCYVGITGAARLLDIEVVPVPEHGDGLRPETVTAVAAEVRARGKVPRALYVVSNFANPSGVSLPVPVRRRVIEVAAAEDVLVLEDDPYGLFGLDDAPLPSLKSLDTEQRVIYLGSFAKSCFPGPRVGFLVADQTVVDDRGRRTLLAAECSAVKSMLTVNTSPIAQAVVGGILVAAGGSLRAFNREKAAFYRRNLRTVLDALERHFPEPGRSARGIRWNSPTGGFFVVVDVPVRADEKLLERSARDYGVLWTPMSFFYSDGGGAHTIRLSCSWLTAEQIEEGVRRLASLVHDLS